MNNTRRRWLRWLLVLSLTICAFMLGNAIGAQCCVPKGSGLAGPIMVLGYGALGAIAGLLVALIAVRSLSDRWLTALTVPLTIGAAVVLILIVNIALKSNAEHAAHMREAYARLNKFTVSIRLATNNTDHAFDAVDVDWAERRFTIARNGQSCSAAMSGEQAVAMLGALRDVELVLRHHPAPCAASRDEILQTLDFRIPEATIADTTGTLALGSECLDAYPALAAPLHVANTIYSEQEHALQCR